MNQNESLVTLESMNKASWYNNWVFKKFKKYLKGDILEVGCGIGNFTKKLSDHGSVTAIDIEDEFLKIAKDKIKEVSIGKGDIEKGRYFFKEKKFDGVVCLNVLEHIKDDATALRNIQRLLKPKGYAVLILPAHQRLYGTIDKAIGHYRRYSKEEILKLLKKNELKLIKIRRVNSLGAIGWFLSGRVFKNNTVSEGKLKLFNIFSRFLLLENIIEPPLGTSYLVIARK
jgi:2-polyprenyl-3-methyl-5-hydroxy-6-metoxy-1,4-benzoquinol methylase